MIGRSGLVAMILLAFVSASRAETAQWMSPGPAIPAVTLLDENGQDQPLADLVGDRPVLVGFFFTGCATICPLQTATMQAVQGELATRHLANMATPLLLSISLDPIGDTPSSVRAYAAQFGIQLGRDHDWLMLSGSARMLAPVWASFEEEGPISDHSGFLWIGQPDNQRWTRVNAMSDAGQIADLLLEKP
ncbi:SCO family protein [Mesorhizobium sp. RP14(2022)]|uniref:SCO family protein n=1 Tax=Mesorhizobium liriopis TaxID=2953882 RepID=A0ABT1CAF7_9HYPH|nr:SCO family protein [Mesorhizobium liriopis]MCO6051772.1 SCO family protein [Mesorhizobium liriopis]